MIGNKKQKGFTLVEAVVVLAIFSVVVLTITSIFISTNRSQRRVLSSQRLQTDARWVMETMIREIKFGTPYYDYYANQAEGAPIDLAKPVHFLAITTANNDHYIYSLLNNKVVVKSNLFEGTQDITPAGVGVDQLNFYITPTSSPWLWDDAANEYHQNIQPRVTIVMETTSTVADLSSSARLHLQTTVSSRVYQR
jgi:prepilin-type N-terminal cleavage/methylation domain-containing protein